MRRDRHGRRVRLDRLGPGDAKAISKIERSVYPAGYTATSRDLASELRLADEAGENLSVGLFDERRLVGYALVYYQPERGEVFEIFGVPQPNGLELEGDSAYLADYVVLPDYRPFAWDLICCVADRIRSFCPGRPVDAFSVESTLHRWKVLGRTIGRLGFGLEREQRVEDATLAEPLFWMSFAPIARTPRPARTVIDVERGGRPLRVELVRGRDWGDAARHWDRLVEETPDATAFASLECLATWFECFEPFGSLYLVSVFEGETPRCLAPLQIAHARIGRRHYRILGFVGDPRELDRPNVLGSPDPAVARALAELVVAQRDEWDVLHLYEQLPDSPWLAAIRSAVESAGCATLEVDGPDCPYTRITGTWPEYLASRSRTLRKGLARRVRQAATSGKLALAGVEGWPDVADALAVYADVERRSWKPAAGLGVRKTPGHWHFYRRLVERLGPLGDVRFSFLELDGKPIAATFGIAKNAKFASLHIAHDRAFDPLSPGVVLTARELESFFERGRFVEVDFLGGYLTNKLSWASDVRKTVTFFAFTPTPRLRMAFWLRRLEPRVKSALARRGWLEPVRAALQSARRARAAFGARLRGGA